MSGAISYDVRTDMIQQFRSDRADFIPDSSAAEYQQSSAIHGDEDAMLLNFLNASLSHVTYFGSPKSPEQEDSIPEVPCHPLSIQLNPVSQYCEYIRYASATSVMEPELATVLETNCTIYDETDALNAAAIQRVIDEDLRCLSLDDAYNNGNLFLSNSKRVLWNSPQHGKWQQFEPTRTQVLM